MKKVRLKTEQERDMLSVIRYPKWCLYLGIGGGGFSLFMTALFLLGPDHIFTDPDYEVRVAASILFILLIIWAVWLILLQLNWRIEIKKAVRYSFCDNGTAFFNTKDKILFNRIFRVRIHSDFKRTERF